MWICDIVLEWLKKIYGWKIWFEYNYLQSRLVIVRFQTEALFTASLMQERWKVKKNYSCILCASNINTVVSSMSCFVVVYFLKAITYMYLAFTSKKQVSKGLLTGDQKWTFSLSKLDTWSSRRETRSSKVSRIENRVSNLKTQVTVDLLLSSAVQYSSEIRIHVNGLQTS